MKFFLLERKNADKGARKVVLMSARERTSNPAFKKEEKQASKQACIVAKMKGSMLS
ncbi:hypothetical protein V2O64_24765 (plasmid) [Verrucomicrobiaceae bacterium 227]